MIVVARSWKCSRWAPLYPWCAPVLSACVRWRQEQAFKTCLGHITNLSLRATSPTHTALQPSLLPSWLRIRTQPQAEARVTPSAGAAAAARARSPACLSQVQTPGPGSGLPRERASDRACVRGRREAEAVGWRAVGPGLSRGRAQKRGGSWASARPGPSDPGGGASPRTSWMDFSCLAIFSTA